MKFYHLTREQLLKGISEHEQAIVNSEEFVRFLSKGEGRPRDLETRALVIHSHQKLVQKLQEEIQAMRIAHKSLDK